MRVLIVCYGFPPNPGVGGRKWAKMARYMIRKGWEVHVLAKRPAPGDQSPWDADTAGCHMHFADSGFPDIITRVPRNAAEKIWYRLMLMLLKFRTRGNYYDRAALMQDEFATRVPAIMDEHGIKNLIVSGAPFSLLYYGALLKQEHPEYRFIADLRDPWMHPGYFGMGLIGEKRKQEEERRLNMALQTADTVIVPYGHMLEDYAPRCGNPSKMLKLPHAVDPDMLVPVQKRPTGSLKLVNFGSQYHGMERLMAEMGQAASAGAVRIDIYTQDLKYAAVTGPAVTYHRPIPEAAVFAKMAEADAVLLYTPEHVRDLISTKYPEVAAMRIPAVVVGRAGKASEFIVSNRLGIFIPEAEISTALAHLPELLAALDYNDQFDYTPYTFGQHVDQLAERLI